MRKLIYLAVVMLLGGCTSIEPVELNCDQLSAAALRSQMLQRVSPEQFQAWLGDTFHLRRESIRVDVSKSGQLQFFEWQKDGVTYSADVQGVTLTFIRVSYEEKRPSAGRLLACLGTPERYRASYERIVEGNQLGLDLLFAAQGILADGAKFTRSDQKQPPVLDGRFPVFGMTIVPPGSVEQVLHEIYGAQPDGLYEKMLSEFRLWPEEWKNLVIEIDPTIGQ